MMKLMVEKPDKTLVAQVTRCSGEACYEIHTDDDSVRKIIQQILNKATKDGLSYHFYRRHKTDTGIRYERLGRRLMPREGEFLQALADYLIHYDLFAYPQDVTSQCDHDN
jgi:phosphoribulokinase